MNELIKLSKENKEFPITSKELYDVLTEDKSHYGRWLKAMITENPFATQNADYQILPIMVKIGERGRPQINANYVLTIKFAKKISMLSKTKRGEIARDYFIACEKKLIEVIKPILVQSDTNVPDLAKMLPEALRLLADNIEKTKVAEQKLIIAQPRLEAYQTFLNIDGLISIKNAAFALKVYLKDGKTLMGQNRLFRYMRDIKVLQKNNLPMQRYSDVFRVKERIIDIGEANIRKDKLISQTFLLPRGLERLRKRLIIDGYVFADDVPVEGYEDEKPF